MPAISQTRAPTTGRGLRSETLWGLILSLLWLGSWALILLTKHSTLSAMPLNELGDFLSGTMSPLALLWLVLGYLQQGKELSLNTEALSIQAHELRLAVKQYEAMVQVAREEAQITKENYQRNLDKDLRHAQPIFQIRENSIHHDDPDQIINLTLDNLGAVVKNLRLSSTDGQIEPREVAILNNGENLNLTLHYQGSPIVQLSVYIEFDDSLSFHHCHRIDAIEEASGNVLFKAPKEVERKHMKKTES